MSLTMNRRLAGECYLARGIGAWRLLHKRASSGEGEMLPPTTPLKPTPFYEGDISLGVTHLTEAQPYSKIYIPMMDEGDLAYRSSDDAMNPDVMTGSIVFLKRTGIESISSGGLYLIVCADFVVLRRVRIVALADRRLLKLEAANPTYDSITIGEDDVQEIYRVSAALRTY